LRCHALAAFVEVDEDRHPWAYAAPAPKGWYAMGRALAEELEVRFGARIDHPKHWAKDRADARRRLLKAQRSIRA
jgi:hypothetical protein